MAIDAGIDKTITIREDTDGKIEIEIENVDGFAWGYVDPEDLARELMNASPKFTAVVGGIAQRAIMEALG